MIRSAFLETAREALALIASRDVQRMWDAPSALSGLSVGALAAHLSRAVSTVEFYIAVALPEPLPLLVSADQYYVDVKLTRDLDDELNTAIRNRSVEAAGAGHSAVVAEMEASIATVAEFLVAAPADRVVVVIFDIAMVLDEYLVTRMVELVTHIDDLATSVRRPCPELPDVTRACVLGCLFAIARRRYGDIELLRALTRAERARPDVFPVF